MAISRQGLTEIVGPEFVKDDRAVLEGYARDESFVLSISPACVVKPHTVDEVQRLVKWANECATPLVPVSSGPPHFYGDTVPSVHGAVMVDLSEMNRILRIDRRNRVVVIEPGVTYEQLEPELAREGLRVTPPLMPRKHKSVIASLLERQPTTIARYQYSMIEPLRNCGVVWGNGEISYTGEAGNSSYSLEEQWAAGERQLDPKGPAQTDFVRLISGAQGTMGIAVWASVKCALVPTAYKVCVIPADRLEDLVECCYWVQRVRLGDEAMLLNRAQLAMMLGADAAQVETLKASLPLWVLIVGLGGRELYPEERVAVQENDLVDIAARSGLKVQSDLPDVASDRLVSVVRNPSPEPYWKLRYKGGSVDILFLSPLNKTPRFLDAVASIAQAREYALSDIAVYIQPQHQGVSYHCELTLPFDPGNGRDVSRVKDLYGKASEDLIAQGAYFSRPYGMWANLVYNRDAASTTALRRVKRVFDPNNVMNPGKLCF